jgi:hypothetical protein
MNASVDNAERAPVLGVRPMHPQPDVEISDLDACHRVHRDRTLPSEPLTVRTSMMMQGFAD